MKQADVIVSRAGSTSIAELTAVGRAAILIPLPTATDDHQTKNAEVLARAGRGGADRAEGPDRRGARRTRMLALARDPARRAAIAAGARARWRGPTRRKVIVDRALELVSE